MTRALAAVISLASCGDNVVPDYSPRSGTRLALVRQDYADGAHALVQGRYFDRVLDADCVPTAWSDGNTYCTPAAASAVFVDDACTRAVGQVIYDENGPPAVPPRFFMQWFQLGAQRRPSRLHAGGGRVDAPTRVWELRDGICFGPMAPGVQADYYALHERDVERVHPREIRIDDELAHVVDLADDGMRMSAGWRDLQLEVACDASDDPRDPSARCVPVAAAAATRFSDAACSAPVVAFSAEAPPAVAKVVDPQTACATYHALGAALDPSPLYTVIGTGCVRVDPPAGQKIAALGRAALLPVLERELDTQAGHRLQAIVLRAGHVEALASVLYDVQLETPCRGAIVEGTIRCVPTDAVEASAYFRDDACTHTLQLARISTAECGNARFARLGDDAPSIVRALGAEYTGPNFEMAPDGRCLPVDRGAARYFEVGAPLIDELVTATESIAPP